MRNDPRMAISATDPDNPCEAVIIQPEAVKGANE